jgi:protein ImuB
MPTEPVSNAPETFPALPTKRSFAAQQPAQKRVLCLWFPNWPIQRLVVSEPELRRQRIVLFRRDSRRGQVLTAASPLAMQDGACVDMPLSEAKSLLRRGTGADPAPFHIFEHDLDDDTLGFEELADSLDTFSPIVGLETIDAKAFKQGRRPHSMLLEVTGLAHLFGDEHQLARELLLHCEQLGYLPRIAIANTVGAASALSRYLAGQHFTQHQQPLVLPANDTHTLRQLPVESLRLEPTVTDTLYQLGIETIGQLEQLPRHDLAMRFGNAIHQRMDQLTGKTEEPVIARRKPAAFQTEQHLEYPTNHRETIEIIIARLVGDLCEQMRAKQRGALEWTITLACQSGPPLELRINLFQPTATTKQVMPLVEMQVEQALSPLTRRSKKKRKIPSPVAQVVKTFGPNEKAQTSEGNKTSEDNKTSENNKATDATHPPTQAPDAVQLSRNQFHRYTTIQIQKIAVAVTTDVLLAQQQRQLFDENPRLDRQSLAQLINRLASRLGNENVVHPSLLSGAQPEYSFRLRPLVDPRRQQRRRKTKPPQQSHTLARPLRLFHPPLRLKNVEVFQPATVPSKNTQPTTAQPANDCSAEWIAQAGPKVLTTFATSEKRLAAVATNPPPALLVLASGNTPAQKVLSAQGPERVETGWWRGITVCRDYWRVETESQQHFWVFRDLRSRNWYLHGEF